MRTPNLWLALLSIAVTTAAAPVYAHPGSAIAVSADGQVFFVDTGAGVFSIDAAGRLRRHPGSAFHWFAFDPGRRFRRTSWPYVPNGELQSAGANPTLILSSDFPVTVGADGRFYYPDAAAGGRARLVAVDPSGARSVRATLPPITSGGRTVTWLNGLASGPDRSLYYAEDRAIRRVDERGGVFPVVENIAVPGCRPIPGIGPEVRPYLRGLAIAADGTIYVAASGCGAVLKIQNGRAAVVLRSSPPWSPTAVAVLRGDVYVLEYLHTPSDDRSEWLPRVRKISKSGTVTTLPGSTRTR